MRLIGSVASTWLVLLFSVTTALKMPGMTEWDTLATALESLPVEILAVVESHYGLTKLDIVPQEIENELVSGIRDVKPPGSLKVAIAPFSTPDKLCYNPYSTKLGSTNIAPTVGLLLKLAEEEGALSSIFVPAKRPGLQAALLAATDDDQVGFSRPASQSNALRLVVVVTTTPAVLADKGKSLMHGDERDHAADRAQQGSQKNDPADKHGGDAAYKLELARPQSEACKLGPPDVSVVAKILKERDIHMIVLALGDRATKAWRTYGAEAEASRYHVIPLPAVTVLAAAGEQKARQLLKDAVLSPEVEHLRKSLLERAEALQHVAPPAGGADASSTTTTAPPTPSSGATLQWLTAVGVTYCLLHVTA